MANYIRVGSNPFTPISFDEMIKPLLLYGQEYREQENALNELENHAREWEAAAMAEKDSKAAKMYTKYADDLRARANDLANSGLNMGSRKAMLDMKSRYNSEINPIKTAFERRKELADEQRKIELSNPTMLWQRKASQMSLDSFIDNPSADYGRSYSGALLTKQVADAAANLAKEAREGEKGRLQLRGMLLPYQYDVVQASGFSREAVMDAIRNSPNANEILTSLVDRVIGSSGVGRLDANGNIVGEGWGDRETRQAALDYARDGLYWAIGPTTHQIVTDQFGLEKYKDRLARSRAAYAASLNNLQVPPGTIRYDQNKSPYKGEVITIKNRKDIANKLTEWKKNNWFTSDGRLNSKGREELRRQSLLVDLKYMYGNAKTMAEKAAVLDRGVELGLVNPYIKHGPLGASEKMSYSEAYKNDPNDNVFTYRGPNLFIKEDRSLYDAARNAGISRSAIQNSGASLTGVTKFNNEVKAAQQGDINIRYVVDTYNQRVTETGNSNKVLASISNLGNSQELEQVASINKDGTIKTGGNKIKISDITSTKDSDTKYKVTNVAFIPSEPGAAMITINGDVYKIKPTQMRKILGDNSYAEYYGATYNAANGKTTNERDIAINNAHNMLARIGTGVKYESVNMDTSGYKNTHDFVYNEDSED